MKATATLAPVATPVATWDGRNTRKPPSCGLLLSPVRRRPQFAGNLPVNPPLPDCYRPSSDRRSTPARFLPGCSLSSGEITRPAPPRCRNAAVGMQRSLASLPELNTGREFLSKVPSIPRQVRPPIVWGRPISASGPQPEAANNPSGSIRTLTPGHSCRMISSKRPN